MNILTNPTPWSWTLTFDDEADGGPEYVLGLLNEIIVEVTFRSNGIERSEVGAIAGTDNGWLKLTPVRDGGRVWRTSDGYSYIGMADIITIKYL